MRHDRRAVRKKSPCCDLRILIVAALAVLPSPSQADVVTHAVATSDSSFTVGPGTKSVIPADPPGDVSGKATARVLPGAIVQNSFLGTKDSGNSFTTGPQTATGLGTTATSQASASISNPGAASSAFQLSTKGTFAKVNPVGTGLGIATATVQDPITYTNTSGQPFTLTYSLGNTFAIGANVAPAGVGFAHSQVTITASSDLPGLTFLFTLQMGVDGSKPNQVGVNFSSNPLLGLNDAAVDSLILSGLTQDPLSGDFGATSGFDYLSLNVMVPTGQNTASFGYDLDVNAEAVVPEPSPLLLATLGATGGLGFSLGKRGKSLKRSPDRIQAHG